MSGNLDALYGAKLAKLNEQKKLSDQMAEMLKTHLVPSSKMACKNMKAAIAVSKKPGVFEYYQPTEDVKNIERNKSLNGLAKRISTVNNELAAMTEEIAAAEAAKTAAAKKGMGVPGESMGLDGWFEQYGRPTPAEDAQKDLLSTFEPARKIYGGTSHHKSFKSSASIMKRGTLTR
jgi:hypothetical protein